MKNFSLIMTLLSTMLAVSVIVFILIHSYRTAINEKRSKKKEVNFLEKNTTAFR